MMTSDFIASTVSSVVHALNDAIAKHNARNPDKTVLLLNFNSLDPALTEAKCSFWHFRFEPHTDMQLMALTKFMASQSAIQKGLSDQSGLRFRAERKQRFPGTTERKATRSRDCRR